MKMRMPALIACFLLVDMSTTWTTSCQQALVVKEFSMNPQTNAKPSTLGEKLSPVLILIHMHLFPLAHFWRAQKPSESVCPQLWYVMTTIGCFTNHVFFSN